jgi:DNA-binding NtrC family response regulator
MYYEATATPAAGTTHHLENEIQAAARARVNVLITGSTAGTRWNIARRIHEAGAGRGSAFIVTHWDDPWMLYADVDMPGQGATIFIEDVSRLDAPRQRALMDFLDRRVASGPSSKGCRIIAGASAPIQDLVAEGEFLEALFYRLNILHLVLPTSGASVCRSPVRYRRFSSPFHVPTPTALPSA